MNALQRQCESASNSRRAFDGKVASHSSRKVAAYCQTEAKSPGIAAGGKRFARRSSLHERLEDRIEIRRWNSNSSISDCNSYLINVSDRAQRHASAGTRELDRVADKIYEYLSCANRVCAHSERWLLRTAAENGLAVEHPVHYGTWANGKGMSFQDIVVFSAR